jgi:hypothetical protein
MAVRQKAKVLEIAHGHFKDFGLPLDIEHKSYLNIVGSREALSAISVKRSFKAWKYLLHALKIKHPELAAAPEQTPAPKETLLTIRNRWRNETADPSPDPYSGVNLATIVNKHGKGLARGSELEKKYMRGALIEIWLQNKARGMDSSKVPVTEDIRWKAADFGDLTPEEEEHLATASESKPKSGLGFGHEQSPSDKKEKKFSGLEILRASIEAKNE